jgi:DNA segregation ATPase FtsK/SpoIIIE, S-DNA-T family
MAKKDKTVDKKSTNKQAKSKLNSETKYGIWGIIFFVFGIFILLSFFNNAGIAGDFLRRALRTFFGFGYYFLPIAMFLIGINFTRKNKWELAQIDIISLFVSFVSVLGILDIVDNFERASGMSTEGGMLGKVVAWPFVKLFDVYAGLLLLSSLFLISLIVLYDQSPDFPSLFQKISKVFSKIFSSFRNVFAGLFGRKTTVIDSEENAQNIPTSMPVEKIEKEEKKESMTAEELEIEIEREVKIQKKRLAIDFAPPPLSLLEKDRGKPNVGDTKGNSNIIQRTLMNFGISVEMDEVTIGPTITRYALKPAQGVKLSRIVGLQNDLALALAAHPIRIEAPIPGKSLVGIEIPNKVKSIVGLATLLSEDKFQNSTKPLTIALGRGLSGRAIFGNLAKMPHMLVAGTTGSGKSVTIHSIITSLLYRNSPEDLRMIMVDPKRVELTLYNKIPHLYHPVITDAKKTILALKWAAKEMDRRYDILEAEAVRDIESYHENVYAKAKKDEEVERMPYIVIIIDELADIMQTYPRELESAIVRLAQMSRAVGIHLILSTQRPSVNIITGLIKANIPTRVALQVSSQIDSRTILDQGGAEKLLGAGDMLYMTADMSQPERLQSAFISEEEVKKVSGYLRKTYEDEIFDTIELSGSIEKGNGGMFNDSIEDEKEDELYEEAKRVVIEAKKASTSLLQRKIGLGYARAAKLIDMMEARGVVGPGHGSKPREVMEALPPQSSSVEEIMKDMM